ncbi:plasmid replication protein RepC [Methylobacterium oryzae]|uniref:Replication initiation protein RepC n=1 Tax=Methylobacterium oryzae TaxID=334852 RepID=A0ABU7TRL0_9HYPH
MHLELEPTTPFGRRPLSLGMMATQAAAKACPDEAIGHKWRIFRDVTEAKEHLAVSDRALAVLSALLTFHPETTLSPGLPLVVFPSNRELSTRSHGPSPATLRRALAQLVEAGLVIRRDSPNGKRYARRDSAGAIARAFGFDLTPLLARAAEFATLAQQVRAAARRRRLLREEIALHRRDLAKTLAFAAESGWPGPWAAFADRFAACGGMPGRTAGEPPLQAAAEALRALRQDLDKWLPDPAYSANTVGNASHSERHHQNSDPDPALESERDVRRSPGEDPRPGAEPARCLPRPLPLPMVLEACPDIVLYARDGIRSWSDLAAAAEVVRPTLRISAGVWDMTVAAMGRDHALVALAAILQRAAAINVPGAYLRDLANKARGGGFSAWPMLFALWRLRQGATSGSLHAPRHRPGS